MERGYLIDDINDLKRLSVENKDLIPCFLDLLVYFKNEEDGKEVIVRCLGVKGFKEVTSTLIEEFKNAKGNLYRWAIGNSICNIQDKTSEKELLKLVTEKRYGTARQMIVYGLWIYNTEETKNILINLLSDEEVQGHALFALGKCGDERAIEHIMPFTQSSNIRIRKEAEKAVKKINRKAR